MLLRPAAAFLGLALLVNASAEELLFIGHAAGLPALYLAEARQAPQQLSRHDEVVFDARWSPDGRHIAYVAAAGRFAQIFVHELASGESRQLTMGEQLSSGPEWSPDGRRIAFVSDRQGEPQVHLVELASGAQRRLAEVGGSSYAPRWSPDGRRIAFVRLAGQRDIWIADAEGGQARPVAFSPVDEDEPIWSPDGSRLLYLVRRATQTECRSVDINSGEMRLLMRRDGQLSSLSFSPDGAWLAFLSNASGSASNLWIARADGSQARRLSDSPRDDMAPRWSLSGPEILYVSLAEVRPRVYAAGLDGAAPRALLDSPGQQMQPMPRPVRRGSASQSIGSAITTVQP